MSPPPIMAANICCSASTGQVGDDKVSEGTGALRWMIRSSGGPSSLIFDDVLCKRLVIFGDPVDQQCFPI